ncbi:ABC transporter substrate-binding protein [Streptomyces sp. NPDC002680]|uniref:ABC transporter substrate-binding protein n=1 Tax=Streptomyces sp. NPDC002680 TaxID=3364659 RepID=UPI003684CA7B
MKRTLFLAASCTVAALTLTACGSGESSSQNAAASSNPLNAKLPDSIRDSGTLKIAGSTTVAPYLYKDGSKAAGFERELMDALGSALGVKVQFSDAGFPALVPGLQSKKFDVAMGDFTDTKERQQAVDFVDYTKSYQSLFVQKGNPKKLTGKDDLCGASVAAATGSISARLAEEQSAACKDAGKKAVKVLQLEDISAAMMQVKTKRADAMLIDVVIGRHVAETGQYGEVVGEPFYPQFHGAAVRKDNTELRDALEAGFKEIIQNGSYGKILEKWGMKDLAMPAPSVNAATS